MSAKPTDRFATAVRANWGNLRHLVSAALNELWQHEDTLSVGQDHDDQVSDALMVGAFVAHFVAQSAGPDEFLRSFEEIFLDKKKIWEWWWKTPFPGDDEDEGADEDDE